MHEPRVYNNSERSTTVLRSYYARRVVQRKYVSIMVMYAERNLITLMSCEVGYVRAAWYGGSTINYGVKMYRVYDRTTVRL